MCLKHLHAVDAPAVAVGRGGRGQIGDRTAGVGLGHANTGHRFTGEDAREITLLLIRRAVFGEHAHRAEVAGLNDVGATRADRSDFFDRDDRVHQRATLTAVGLWHGDTHQALFGHQPGDVKGMLGLMRTFKRALGEMFFGKAAHGGAKHFLFFAQFEIHAVCP